MQNVESELMILFCGAKDKSRRDKLVSAETAAIAYYYDVLAEHMATTGLGLGDMKPIDMGPMQDAVRAINQECANQKRPYLFSGNIRSMKDLFPFAAEIAVPGIMQKAGATA